MSNKLIFIGSYAKGTIAHGGELAKNQQFVNRFGEVYDKFYPVDTNDWKHRPWLPLLIIWHLLVHGRNTRVVISCQNMAYPLIVFLYYFRLKKHIIYWVIGSEIVRRIKAEGNNQASFKKKYFHYLDKIIVESSMMERQLMDEGLRNVVTIPNFKKIFHVKPIVKSKTGVVRFVFLSRISPEKGCNYILNCVEKLNKAGYKDMFRVTFYGMVEEGYVAFNSRVDSLENVEYKGLLDLTNIEGYEVMADNDVFLFPTFFPNEGFPGALIDAMIAGLPVIASDWNYNKELVVEGKTGVVIPAHDEERLYEEILAFIEGKHDIARMREACLKEASKYDVEEVLSVDKLVNLGVMTK